MEIICFQKLDGRTATLSPSLQERIRLGALTVDEALTLAKQSKRAEPELVEEDISKSEKEPASLDELARRIQARDKLSYGVAVTKAASENPAAYQRWRREASGMKPANEQLAKRGFRDWSDALHACVHFIELRDECSYLESVEKARLEFPEVVAEYSRRQA